MKTKADEETFKKWNTILKNDGLGVISPGKPNDNENKLKKKSKKKWLPEWAHWGKPGKTYGKGSRK